MMQKFQKKGKKVKKKVEKGWEIERKERIINLIDVIAPPSLEIKPNYIKIGDKIARTYFVLAYPSSVTTNWLSPIINFDRIFDISMMIYPVATSKILKQLQRKITEVEAQIMEREKRGLVRDPALETGYRNIEDLRDKLIQAQERMFKFSFYFTIYTDNEKDLGKREKEIRQLLESQLIYIKPTLFRQKEGFESVSPLFLDEVSISTSMNTSPLSASFPFVSFELTSDKGILYGINRHNNSLIIFDRFSLENGNIVIFAKSGSGKSYLQKVEILRSLTQGIDVIIIDPENEYKYLAEIVGGSYFNISLTSPHHINPLDLPPQIEGETKEGLFRSNIITLVGLLRLMLGGLTAEEDSLIDNAISLTYESQDITPSSDFYKQTAPLLSDLGSILEGMEGAENLTIRLEKYTKGTFSGLLNNRTNTNLENKLIVFSIRDLEDELRPIAMFLILHYIWNIIRSKLKKRLLIVDEGWWMMQYEDGASFLYGLAKRARKYYLGVSTITQDVDDFMKSRYGQPIITNSSLQILLKQSPATINLVADTFNLTREEKYLLLQAEIGEGLFFAGTKHVAMKVVASYGEDQIITTDPEQLLAIKKAKEELEGMDE